jgi:hypothetical protein
MMLSVPVPKDDGSADKIETWPLLVVNPVGNNAGWLDDARAALETLVSSVPKGRRGVNGTC